MKIIEWVKYSNVIEMNGLYETYYIEWLDYSNMINNEMMSNM